MSEIAPKQDYPGKKISRKNLKSAEYFLVLINENFFKFEIRRNSGFCIIVDLFRENYFFVHNVERTFCNFLIRKTKSTISRLSKKNIILFFFLKIPISPKLDDYIDFHKKVKFTAP
jgi:hypothetical protein